MRIEVFSIFPEYLRAPLEVSLIGRARRDGLLSVGIHDPRDHATDRHRTVDDEPFGGGPGMVMRPEPLFAAVEAVEAPRPVLLCSASGHRFTQAWAAELAAGEGFSLLCGRYEGVDQRFVDAEVDLEVSLGDFVLSGGELPALALLDAVARLQPGVLHGEDSAAQDSFAGGLLEGPHYTRPEVLGEGAGARAVPAVLLSGHHAQIARWRRERALERTARQRPDLIAAARATGALGADDEAFLRSLGL